MQVKLISHSTAPAGTDLDNVQDLIAYCAKVSNPSNQINKETSAKLISYLIKHNHWSPLEMVSACLEIETTRDIAHQIVRHRSFAFQEFSQRYAEPSAMGDAFTTRECRLQDTTNRQNSIEIENDPSLVDNQVHQELADYKSTNPSFNIEQVHFFPLGGMKRVTDFVQESA